MNLHNIRNFFSRNLHNFYGWRTSRKIVVFESDDWGSIRMPSKKVYEYLLKKSIPVDKDFYCKYDSLESEDDLCALFDVLKTVKDQNGNHPVITANCVVANPDFEKIELSDFNQYFYEPFTRTYDRYGATHANSWKVWNQGMNDGIFKPQFHGREHLNIINWLYDLRNENIAAKEMFLQKNWTFSVNNSRRYMASFSGNTEQELFLYKEIIKDGLSLFESLFNYKSKSFIASCHCWGDEIEKALNLNEVRFIQGAPRRRDTQTLKIVGQYIGKTNQYNQRYLMRNATFEPSQHAGDWVSNCLREMEISFFYHKPVTVSTHRINFIGSIDEKNRANTLSMFSKLLKAIVKRWPDVEFLSSDQLGAIIDNNRK